VLSCDSLPEVVGGSRFDLIVSNELDSTLCARSVSTLVIFERADDCGWVAYLPDVLGVVALGETRGEVAAGIEEALEVYADEMRSPGKVLAAPTETASTVQAG
jgi:predicted RNase H-like HicB family nuclease